MSAKTQPGIPSTVNLRRYTSEARSDGNIKGNQHAS